VHSGVVKVLLLGGTGEARQLAGLLVGEPGIEVVSSLAGRVADAQLPVGEVRQGGFGGIQGLVAWLRDHKVDAVIDATHPFAATMTAHAAEAARQVGVPLLVLRRRGWTAGPGDDWHWADTLDLAAELTTALASKIAQSRDDRVRVFLTIGRQGLDPFAGLDLWMLARCVDPPDPRPTWCELLLDRGPYSVAGERELLIRQRIDVLVTKDSGGPMTAAKLTAARELSVPVVLVRRPELPTGVAAVDSAAQVVDWLLRLP
jgi:precorrin-6A/cobalt-precorrin-6A reductase